MTLNLRNESIVSVVHKNTFRWETLQYTSIQGVSKHLFDWKYSNIVK